MNGLTLRQHYKLAALAGCMASENEQSGDWLPEGVAVRCGVIADAMIEEDEAFLERDRVAVEERRREREREIEADIRSRSGGA